MNFAGIRRVVVFSATLLAAISHSAFSETIRIQPVADTTLAEFVPDNNFGGTEFVIAGAAGVNANGALFRALYRFAFDSIPANSKIKSASLQLEVTFAPSSGQFSSFALHRMLKDWGEGDKDSSKEQSPGLGFPATVNEATWNSPLAFTTNAWTSPGALNDFAAIVSSRTDVYSVGDFPLFNSTGEMVSDVQTWLENPSANFGWLLKTEAEDEFFTARRFGSREFVGEDTNSPPYLEIEFVPPPTISDPHVANGQFNFSFLAEANETYRVDFKSALGSTNAWQTLTNISAPPAPTNVLISDVISTNARFYRVVLP